MNIPRSSWFLDPVQPSDEHITWSVLMMSVCVGEEASLFSVGSICEI